MDSPGARLLCTHRFLSARSIRALSDHGAAFVAPHLQLICCVGHHGTFSTIHGCGNSVDRGSPFASATRSTLSRRNDLMPDQLQFAQQLRFQTRKHLIIQSLEPTAESVRVKSTPFARRDTDTVGDLHNNIMPRPFQERRSRLAAARSACRLWEPQQPGCRRPSSARHTRPPRTCRRSRC